MISVFLVSGLLPLLFGWLWLGLLARPRDLPSLLLFLGLSYGIGLGLLSSAFFPWMMIAGPAAKGFTLVVFGAAILAVLLLRRKYRPETWTALPDSSPSSGLVIALTLVLLAIAAALFLFEMKRQPHGGYDAWAFWNMRARFLFRAGDSWPRSFSWRTTHNSYPLLLTSSQVLAWNTLGRESLAVAKWIAAGFAASTLAALTGSLSLLRGKSRAWLGAGLLLCQPFFVIHAASLYADVPLGFYFLATFVLVAIHDDCPGRGRLWLFLAGMSAGMAAWTKNEGVIFVLAILGARVLTRLTGRRLRALWCEGILFAAGLFPWFAMNLYFRLSLPDKAPPIPGALATAGLSLYQRVTDPLRHWIILKSFFREILWSPAFSYLGPGILLLLFAAAFWRRQPSSWSWRCSVFALILLLLGYYGAYLLSSHDLDWQLRFSLDRLLLQTWPSMVFLALLRNNSAPQSAQSK